MSKDRIAERLGKTLTDLEDDDWGIRPHPTTRLITECHRLRHKKLEDLTDEDLRLLIGQQIGLFWTVPLALKRVAKNPAAAGDMSPGALRDSLARVANEYWNRHPDQLEELECLRKIGFAPDE